MRPDIKILAISNVYCRLMNFKKKGDMELGHFHDYDHGTLLSTGKLKVEMVSDDNKSISVKEFEAPTFIFIEKNKRHIITALEDNTIASCIHALRTDVGEIVDPEFLVKETELADTPEKTSSLTPSVGDVFKDKGLNVGSIAYLIKSPIGKVDNNV
jgi:hypothetical protein